ncbi:MAG: 16S rRNA (cytidine(1402)-2'-O)-methyltransferase [Candidatus Yanofskybacteria bacterium RIFCSPHIGHO2_02_FULL_50_12]|uniref:Ribosomal RNA small subunit methyltransferase I n=1 Tax=Candidatus Yanofskybacteria bacterium RIFCSPHIGHO2_02_FULL_50_12 TaxID=1802685 RepID=A0A1F8FXF5_9BACT|nr:MAG: 16S rRNA (cytidine(1402)-2'-O)-methyltransferase [Candidatus Yanofskybacteria bacterium RIFCSPHIGHO2_02_FULL_50_12]
MAKLFIVATPIGNLADISLRAITVLSNADLILAEDTRVTRTLLEHYNIKKEMLVYHQHSNPATIRKIISLLRSGKNLALVSDAGTPGINDPGNFLIQEVLKELPDLAVVPVPGANAAIAALSISGFPTDRFTYLGFPPHKKGRQIFFKRIGEIEHAVVLYESKFRILKTLEALALLGRPLVVCREITKQFETVYRLPVRQAGGTAEDIKMKLHDKNLLGEFVIVVGPKPRKIKNDEE